jgi:Immunoglobulin-like domain of bacterial spore germination
VTAVSVAWPGGQAASVTRAPGIEVLAGVWVLAPSQGETARSPVVVSGTASVFEATVTWEVDRPDGTVVAHGIAMTPIAAPWRGPWSFTGSLPPGSYVVLAYAVSARHGSHTWPDSRTIAVR